MKTDEELLEKWKPILDYEDNGITPIPEYWKPYIAKLLENTEYKYTGNRRLLSIIIPMIRYNLDDVIYDEVFIQNKKCLIVKGIMKTYMDRFLTEGTFDLKQDISNAPTIIFKLDEGSGEWKLFDI